MARGPWVPVLAEAEALKEQGNRYQGFPEPESLPSLQLYLAVVCDTFSPGGIYERPWPPLRAARLPRRHQAVQQGHLHRPRPGTPSEYFYDFNRLFFVES